MPKIKTELSNYNKQHLESQIKALDAFNKLSENEICRLKWLSLAYIKFRRELDSFTKGLFYNYCNHACFKNRQSKCCGFESIMTFFADEILNIIWGGPEKAETLIKVLEQPNESNHCVYLGEDGCLWYLKPLSCAMFFCEDAKKHVFARNLNAEKLWTVFTKCEKNFTWPDKPVLFDIVEKFFIIKKGVFTPHMYFHLSPGLLKVKKESCCYAELPAFF